MSRILNNGWGDSEKLINTLYRYSRSSNFGKKLFPILFESPILIGMNSNQIKDILKKVRDFYKISDSQIEEDFIDEVDYFFGGARVYKRSHKSIFYF